MLHHAAIMYLMAFFGGFGQFVFFPRGICVVNRGKTYWASDPFAPWRVCCFAFAVFESCLSN